MLSSLRGLLGFEDVGEVGNFILSMPMDTRAAKEDLKSYLTQLLGPTKVRTLVKHHWCNTVGRGELHGGSGLS